jgi:cell division septum initiation protein DivIVA
MSFCEIALFKNLRVSSKKKKMNAFTREEIELCLDLLEKFIPVSDQEWKQVEDEFNQLETKKKYRTVSSIQRKLKTIVARFKNPKFTEKLNTKKTNFYICTAYFSFLK